MPVNHEPAKCLGDSCSKQCVSQCPHNNLAYSSNGASPAVTPVDTTICDGVCHQQHPEKKPCEQGCQVAKGSDDIAINFHAGS